jgi:hypothetical protein
LLNLAAVAFQLLADEGLKYAMPRTCLMPLHHKPN